jgi:hypothetical protein
MSKKGLLTVKSAATGAREKKAVVVVHVAPGICGFDCTVKASRIGERTAAVAIQGSQCAQIQLFAAEVGRIRLNDLFLPIRRNPVYICAEKSGCHPACVVPAAVLKAVEAALAMAIPRNIRISFKSVSTPSKPVDGGR